MYNKRYMQHVFKFNGLIAALIFMQQIIILFNFLFEKKYFKI